MAISAINLLGFHGFYHPPALARVGHKRPRRVFGALENASSGDPDCPLAASGRLTPAALLQIILVFVAVGMQRIVGVEEEVG